MLYKNVRIKNIWLKWPHNKFFSLLDNIQVFSQKFPVIIDH